MSRRSGGLRLSREKLVCYFPLFSEKRGKLPFRRFQGQINHLTRFLLQSPFILYIMASEEPTAGQHLASRDVFRVGSFCHGEGCCSSDFPRQPPARPDNNSNRIPFRVIIGIHLLIYKCAFEKVPAGAAGFLCARGASRSEAMELVLPSRGSRQPEQLSS